MSEFVHFEPDLPALREPLLVVAFGGAWGSSALAALEHIADERGTRLLASIEAERFVDLTVHRPVVSIEDAADSDGEDGPGLDGARGPGGTAGGQRVLSWPEIRFELLEAGAAADVGRDNPRDIVLLLGPEPHLRWADFAAAVTAAMERIGVRESVMLGAFRMPTPHSRPVPLQLYTSDQALASALRLPGEPWRYEGPASITTLLSVACEDRGWPTASLIAAAPFYVDAEPQPHATLALVRALARALDIEVDLESLEDDVRELDAEAEEARGRSEPFAALVANLEQEYDRGAGSFDSIDLAAAPTAPELLADVAAFLEERRGGGEAADEGAPPSGEPPR